MVLNKRVFFIMVLNKKVFSCCLEELTIYKTVNYLLLRIKVLLYG